MTDVTMPLLVCVSPDAALRELIGARLDDLGQLLLCADLGELHDRLFATPAPPLVATPARPVSDNGPAHPLSDTGPGRPGPIRFGALAVDIAGHRVTWQGRPLEVTRLERRLLARLASPPGRVWSYERLFAAVWGGAYLGDTAILHSAVKRLRRKLRAVEAGPQVQTVRGVGYRLALPD
ncbi:winged helix-turn-helix domain-containing protein [Micromonosporaceae bacterium DT55]|uniref:winged helix-turn-helix domain-containing protein n=1 Tax=Melissospora conviva TaxID=3388432 RepID=UPI003C21CFDE